MSSTLLLAFTYIFRGLPDHFCLTKKDYDMTTKWERSNKERSTRERANKEAKGALEQHAAVISIPLELQKRDADCAPPIAYAISISCDFHLARQM